MLWKRQHDGEEKFVQSFRQEHNPLTTVAAAVNAVDDDDSVDGVADADAAATTATTGSTIADELSRALGSWDDHRGGGTTHPVDAVDGGYCMFCMDIAHISWNSHRFLNSLKLFGASAMPQPCLSHGFRWIFEGFRRIPTDFDGFQ